MFVVRLRRRMTAWPTTDFESRFRTVSELRYSITRSWYLRLRPSRCGIGEI
jgi:hypothetical protein